MSTLPRKTFPGYGLGDFGFNLVFQFTQVYLSYFFAEVFGLSGTQAALIFLLARIWDAINDPLMGMIANRTRTRWGTFRPYLLWSILPLAGSLLLLFYAPRLEGGAAFAYALTAYILFGMAFTFGNIPYGALTATLSENYHVRSKLTGWRMTLGIVGGMVAVGSARPLSKYFTGVTGSEATGWFITAGIFAAIMALALLGTFLLVKEKEPVRSLDREDENLLAGWKTLQDNRPFWILTLAFVFNFIALTLITGSIPFFFEFYLRDSMLEPTVTAMVFGVAALSVPAWAWLARRSSKRNVYIAGLLAYLSGLLGVYFLGHLGINTLYASFFLVGLGAGASAYAGWAMLPDTVEFGEWKSGTRHEGAVYGVYGFFFKLGIGLGLVFLNVGLEAVGYIPKALAQSDAARQGIRGLTTLGPVLMLVLSGISIWFYKLGPASHGFILTELRRRKNILEDIGTQE